MIVAYPTKYEVYHEGDDTPIAKFKMFDDESFNIKIDRISYPDELREIADILEEVLETNKTGIRLSEPHDQV